MQTYDELHRKGTPETDWPWRVAPLVSAGIVYVVTFLNSVALLLAPLALAVTVMAFRRSDRKGVLLGFGLTVNLLLNIWLIATIANVVRNGR